MKTVLLLAALLPGCAPVVRYSVPTAQERLSAALFAEQLKKDPDGVWDASVRAEVLQAVKDFKAGKRLPNGFAYGASVKDLDLRGMTPARVEAVLKERGFVRYDDVVRKDAKPVFDKDGKTIPQIVYIHPDGGTVRIKPLGDPTSAKRPQPHLSKSVRYPYDGDRRDFKAEGFKVDMAGRPLPKAPSDLKNPYRGTPLEETFQDGWGDAAHADLPMVFSR